MIVVLILITPTKINIHLKEMLLSIRISPKPTANTTTIPPYSNILD